MNRDVLHGERGRPGCTGRRPADRNRDGTPQRGSGGTPNPAGETPALPIAPSGSGPRFTSDRWRFALSMKDFARCANCWTHRVFTPLFLFEFAIKMRPTAPSPRPSPIGWERVSEGRVRANCAQLESKAELSVSICVVPWLTSSGCGVSRAGRPIIFHRRSSPITL